MVDCLQVNILDCRDDRPKLRTFKGRSVITLSFLLFGGGKMKKLIIALTFILSISVFATQTCIYYSNDSYSLPARINEMIKKGYKVQFITKCDNGFIVLYDK